MGSAKSTLKALRAVPALSRPATTSVRFVAARLGVTPEFAIKHLPRSGLTTARLPNGRRARFWSRGDDWVANQVFWRGWDGYEGEVARLFWRLALNANVIIDVGAHVGYFTLLAGLANPCATVVALEPLPAVFERLRRNIRLNRLENVVALPQAAGVVDGRADFYHVPGIIPSSSSLSSDFMRSAAGVERLDVDVVRLDRVARTHGLDRVDLVKLDTETTEPDVLAGMGSLLSEYRPNIVCEVLTRADVSALTLTLKPLGYAFYHLTDRGPKRRQAITPHGRWLNYLFTARREGPEPIVS
jgi:FkbM family methyltransferase